MHRTRSIAVRSGLPRIRFAARRLGGTKPRSVDQEQALLDLPFDAEIVTFKKNIALDLDHILEHSRFECDQ